MTEKAKIDETVTKTERHVITGDAEPGGTETQAEKSTPDASEAAANSGTEGKSDDQSGSNDSDKASNEPRQDNPNNR